MIAQLPISPTAPKPVYTSGDMHIISALLHLNQYLPAWVQQYGTQIYGILFVVVFAETGLVIFPVLPGDSLLFAAGAVAAAGSLNAPSLYILFICAALLGDNVNYWIGRKFGRQLFQKEDSKIFKRSNLAKTEAFFVKYGPKAIIMARFVPIVRTFSPFVAGMGQMEYAKFLTFSAIGAVLWVGICVSCGLLFGKIPAVSKHFDIAVIAVIVVSLLPVLVEFLLHRKRAASEIAS